MTKPRTMQGTPDEPESTTEPTTPEDAHAADRTASADTLLSPSTATEPSIKNR